MSMHDALHITAFFDGSPGHGKQTNSVLRALQELTPLSISHRKIPEPGLMRSIRDWFIYIKTSLISNLSKPDGSNPVDLIIGAGARTHLPMLIYKKEHPAKIVTCMNPGFPLYKKMDLCLVPRHDLVNPAKRENVFLTIGPPVIAETNGKHAPQKGLILIGGVDEKSHHWDLDLLRNQVYSILERKTYMDWTISSSPRTPDSTMLMLRKVAADNTNVSLFTSRETPDGWIERMYSACQSVWVTADSISMVYEALAFGCCVGLLPVKWKRQNSKFQRSVNFLIETKRVITYDSWMTGRPMVRGAALNEAARCAREILRRWWPDRLP